MGIGTSQALGLALGLGLRTRHQFCPLWPVIIGSIPLTSSAHHARTTSRPLHHTPERLYRWSSRPPPPKLPPHSPLPLVRMEPSPCSPGPLFHATAADSSLTARLINDVWSLGIILLNLLTGRNLWNPASLSDPTFYAYFQDPTCFPPTVLPISDEVNTLLVRILNADWKYPTVTEMKEHVKQIDNLKL